MDRSNSKESLFTGRKGDLKKEVEAEKGEQRRTEKGRREEERKKKNAHDAIVIRKIAGMVRVTQFCILFSKVCICVTVK